LSSSKDVFLKLGSFTSGDIEAVLFVGPIEPATNLGLLSSFKENSSAISRAIFAL